MLIFPRSLEASKLRCKIEINFLTQKIQFPPAHHQPHHNATISEQFIKTIVSTIYCILDTDLNSLSKPDYPIKVLHTARDIQYKHKAMCDSIIITIVETNTNLGVLGLTTDTVGTVVSTLGRDPWS